MSCPPACPGVTSEQLLARAHEEALGTIRGTGEMETLLGEAGLGVVYYSPCRGYLGGPLCLDEALTPRCALRSTDTKQSMSW